MRPVILTVVVALSALVAVGSAPSRAADFEPPYSGQPEPGPYGAAPPPYGVAPIPEQQVVVEPGPYPYVYGGYRYCWFPGGWRGPGWYVCNYGPWVSGYWWGGPYGWRGWGGYGGRFYGGGFRGYGFHGGGFHGGGFHGGGFHGGFAGGHHR
jgi:hypothetical protein